MNLSTSTILVSSLVAQTLSQELPVTSPHAAVSTTVNDHPNEEDPELAASTHPSSESPSEKGSNNLGIIIAAALLAIIAIISVVMMIICLRKYRKARRSVTQQISKKDASMVGVFGAKPPLHPPPGAAGKKPMQQQMKALASAKSQPKKKALPKEIKIAGSPAATTTGSGKVSPATGSGKTTTSTATKKSTTDATLPSPLKKLVKPKRGPPSPVAAAGLGVDVTQSSFLEPIHENEELKINRVGTHQRTFVCFNGNEWYEPQPGETDDFSFEIESDNTFSMISN